MQCRCCLLPEGALFDDGACMPRRMAASAALMTEHAMSSSGWRLKPHPVHFVGIEFLTSNHLADRAVSFLRSRLREMLISPTSRSDGAKFTQRSSRVRHNARPIPGDRRGAPVAKWIYCSPSVRHGN